MLRALACIVLALTGLVACQRAADGEGASDSGASAVASRDAMWAEEFAKGQEARGWLGREDTRMFEISKEDASALVERLYAAGSPKVVMADAARFSEESRVEIGATFIAELPTDPSQRAAVFKVDEEWSEDPEKDQGQKYLAVATD